MEMGTEIDADQGGKWRPSLGIFSTYRIDSQVGSWLLPRNVLEQSGRYTSAAYGSRGNYENSTLDDLDPFNFKLDFDRVTDGCRRNEESSLNLEPELPSLFTEFF